MKSDRTGTGTQSVFGYQARYDLSEGFPLLTTKKLHLKSIIYELLWFIAGDTNVKYLQDHGVRIWNEWADENGDLGPVYGHQWRSWPTPDGGTIDQLSNVINQIKNTPDSRRMIVSAWNVAEVEKMAVRLGKIFFSISFTMFSEVLCGRWQAFMPVVSAQCRCLPRCSIQYRFLRAPDNDDCPGLRIGAR